MAVTFEQLQEAARRVLEGARAGTLSPDGLEAFIRMVEDWVSGQPDWLKNSYVGYFSPAGPKAVKRADLPRVLRSDPDFLMRFLRLLAGVA